MSKPIFQVTSGTSNPLDVLQGEMNRYTGRGFPGGVSLTDALPDRAVAASGVLWGTTNTSSYAANGSNMTATTTKSMTFGNIYAVPFFHAVGHGIGAMGLRSTAVVANAVAVFGIYDSIEDGFGNIYPGQKLWQSTEVAVATAVSRQASPNLVLPPGRVYWAVYHGGVATATLTSLAVGACGSLLGYSTGAGAPTLQTHLTGALTYSTTMPSRYPAGQTAAATDAPFLWISYDPSQMQTFAKSFPIWSPSDDGYAVRGVRLIAGSSTIQSGAGRPSAKVSVRIVNASGSNTLGSFTSAGQGLKPGAPYYLTDPKADATPLPKDSVLEAYVEQRGWPLLSIDGCRVCCDLIRTRP